MKRLVRLTLVLLLIATCLGARCDRFAPKPTAPTHPLTKVEYFKDRQTSIKLTHGTIDMTSVEETSDGVKYRTTDGSQWKVTMEKTADGWRIRGAPERVEATP